MVTSTNGLIDSGKVDTENFTYNETEGYGRGTFSLSLTEQMIPEAHILVSVLADDGTLLADEAKFEVDLSLLSSQPVELEIGSIVANDDRLTLIYTHFSASHHWHLSLSLLSIHLMLHACLALL